MECIFCSIRDRAIPAEIVDEDDHTLSFLDVHPQAPGHTVVIPKQHCAYLTELPDEEGAHLFRALKRVARRLIAALSADGLTVGVNHGEVSGQTVLHLHVHLFPRFTGDGGGSVHSVVNNPPSESLAAIAAKIRGAK